MEPVLFVDIQAAGSSKKGFPLEIAWKTPGGEVHSFFFRNPEGCIPPEVMGITGISPGDLSGPKSLPEQEIGFLFAAAARDHILVAHHAVYEKSWIEGLWGGPFQFICTRTMARETLKDLRSASLRSVAARAGLAMGRARRSAEHVVATERIYECLQNGFPDPPDVRQARLSLPSQPGVYRFLDCRGRLLYIGKAGNLRSRVNSHFTGRSGSRRGEMLERTTCIQYETVETPFHAAVLESNLIGSLSPEYNRAGIIHSSSTWYLSADMTRVSASRSSGSYGPFTSAQGILPFSILVSSMIAKKIDPGLVESFTREIHYSVLEKVFNRWRSGVPLNRILQYGISLHDVLEDDVADESHEEYLIRKFNSVLAYGAFLCRRAAALRMITGCTVTWYGKEGSTAVHDYADSPVPGECHQLAVRRAAVVLSETRRVWKKGRNPRIILGNGPVIAGEELAFLFSVI